LRRHWRNEHLRKIAALNGKENAAKKERTMQRNEHGHEIKAGFLKLMRSPESQELLHSDPLAFALLTVIALRARWRSALNVRGLEFGEALIGDHNAMGFTRAQYRTRLSRLVKWGLVTTRPTRRGTIARLTSTTVFDINAPPNEWPNNKNQPSDQPSNLRGKTVPQQPSTQPTSNQQPTNSQPLTKKKRREERKNVAAERAREGTTGASETALANLEELKKIARQAGNDSAQLIAALQPHFPELDVSREFSAYSAWMKKKNLRATALGFVRWLLRCEPSLKPLPRKKISNGAKPPQPPEISDEKRATIIAEFKAANRAAGLVSARPEEPF
jgi:hypothetical protein